MTLLAQASVVVTRPWAALAALAVLVTLIGLAHGAVRSRATQQTAEAAASPVARRRRGIKALVIGADGRASTSKVQVVLWTFAVFYAFVFLLLWGRSTRCGEDALQTTARCQEALEGRAAFAGLVDGDLQPEYYVLLGFPMAAAVAAKALTTTKVAEGAVVKPPVEDGQDGIVQGLSEVISNDAGETDLMDFQYFAFNLLTLAFFLIEFLTDPAAGLPDIPPTLLALSGASVAVYTAKKALEGAGAPAPSGV